MQTAPDYVIDLTDETETTPGDTYELVENEAIIQAELNRLDEINPAVEVETIHSIHPTGEPETTPNDTDEMMEMAAIMQAELNRLDEINPAGEVETLHTRRHAKSTGGIKKKKSGRKPPVPASIQSRLHKVRNPENYRRISPPKANQPKRNIRYGDRSVDTVPIWVLKKSKTLTMLLKIGSTETSEGHILLVEDGDDIPGGELGIEQQHFRKFWTWAETANYDIKGMVDEIEMEDANGFWRIYAHSCLFDLAVVLDCPAFKGKIFHHMEREKTLFLVHYNCPGDEVARQKETIISIWKKVKEKTPRKYITLNWSMDELYAETHEDNARGIVRI